jgi:uncharacterized membrane protein
LNPLTWLPPIPSWEGIHPLIIHFPVALLFVAPLHIVGMLAARRVMARDYQPALSLMILGTLGAYFAYASGMAAASVASDLSAEAAATLARHADLAGDTRMAFTVLTVLYALLLYGPVLLKKQVSPLLFRAGQGVFLALYGAGMLLLMWTADKGGHLVHQFGVKALIQ